MEFMDIRLRQRAWEIWYKNIPWLESEALRFHPTSERHQELQRKIARQWELLHDELKKPMDYLREGWSPQGLQQSAPPSQTATADRGE